MLKKTKSKNLKIFGCPECRRRFISTRALNTHLTKSHGSKYVIMLTAEHRACARRKL